MTLWMSGKCMRTYLQGILGSGGLAGSQCAGGSGGGRPPRLRLTRQPLTHDAPAGTSSLHLATVDGFILNCMHWQELPIAAVFARLRFIGPLHTYQPPAAKLSLHPGKICSIFPSDLGGDCWRPWLHLMGFFHLTDTGPWGE